MKDIYQTYRPSGFHNVNVYLFSEEPEQHIEFLKKAFSAIEKNRSINPNNGEIANCILSLEDSSIMVSQARGKYLGMRASMYLFVSDVDKVYEDALANGGTHEMKPMDMHYGERQAGVVDPAGNIWWISKRLKDDDY